MTTLYMALSAISFIGSVLPDEYRCATRLPTHTVELWTSIFSTTHLDRGGWHPEHEPRKSVKLAKLDRVKGLDPNDPLEHLPVLPKLAIEFVLLMNSTKCNGSTLANG